MEAKGRIKNWAAGLPAEEYMAAIREALHAHGAVKIRFERASKNAPVASLTFEKLVDTSLYHFRLAPDGERVRTRVMESKGRINQTAGVLEQAYRTTWANVRDYVASALGLVELGSHGFEQVFFPFLLSDKTGDEAKTYFEVFEAQRALPKPGDTTASAASAARHALEGSVIVVREVL